jgi:nucleoside-diphosphate-sugar epimerase
MKTILITGGAGYVGSTLLRVLLRNGYRVVCFDKLLFGGESLLDIWNEQNFVFIKGDVTDFGLIKEVLTNHKIDAVVHLAAIVGDPACKREPGVATRTNWEASKSLLEQCIENNVRRFIFASTCSNYGKMSDPNVLLKETSPLLPVSLYAELKVRFENYLVTGIRKIDNFAPTSLRFATVYGLSPRMRFDLTVNEFTKEIASGRELVVYGEHFWRPYCHVADFSRAIMHVLEAPEELVAYNVFNVGDTKENYTKKMIVDEIIRQIPAAKVKYIHKDEDPRDYRVSFDKINQSLGFKISRTVPDGIKEVKDVIQLGVICDPEAQRFYNIQHAVK